MMIVCIKRAPPPQLLFEPFNFFFDRPSPVDIPNPPRPDTLLGHRGDLFVLPVLPVRLAVSHQRLPLLQLPLVLGHQRGVDAAISRCRHHHDAHNAAHHAGNHHRADGPAHAHRSIAGADAISRGLPASACIIGASITLVRYWRGPTGAQSVPAARRHAPLSGPRSLTASVLVFQLEAVVEHFHRNAADVPPTQILG